MHTHRSLPGQAVGLLILTLALGGCDSPNAHHDLAPGLNCIGHAETYGFLLKTESYPVEVEWDRLTDSTRLFVGPDFSGASTGQVVTAHFLLRDSTWFFGKPGDEDPDPVSGYIEETQDSVILRFINVDVGEVYFLRKI